MEFTVIDFTFMYSKHHCQTAVPHPHWLLTHELNQHETELKDKTESSCCAYQPEFHATAGTAARRHQPKKLGQASSRNVHSALAQKKKKDEGSWQR